MKKTILLIITTILCVIFLGGGLYFFYTNHTTTETLHTVQTENEGYSAEIEALKETLAQKEEYLNGQDDYIEELNDLLSNLQDDENEDVDSDYEEDSSYEEDYPELYAQAEYEKRYGKDEEDDDTVAKDKVVYLTFDDGPSYITPDVLDLLDEYDAKATFFVIYSSDPEYAKYLKEIVNRGHTLALHSYSHNYQKIYASVDSFLTDFEKVYNWVYEETGQRPTLYRFPGGSTNGSRSVTNAIKEEMSRRGFIYYDWNVSSGDGSNRTSTENIIKNICSNVDRFDFPVVLMHDGLGKEQTLNALPTVLETLDEKGYLFETLEPYMEPVQF